MYFIAVPFSQVLLVDTNIAKSSEKDKRCGDEFDITTDDLFLRFSCFLEFSSLVFLS